MFLSTHPEVSGIGKAQTGGQGHPQLLGKLSPAPPPSDTRLTFGPSGLEGREGDYAQALTTWTPPLLPPHQACPGCDSCFHVFSGQR